MDYNIPFFIIDDEEAVILTLKKIISKVFPNSRINTFNDGLDAWKFIEKNKKPMVVVSDINIPGINGLQVLGKVRSDKECAQIYFIIITSSADKETNLTVLKKGADDFITKPFSVDFLVSKLRNAARTVRQYLLMNEEKRKFDELLEELYDNTKKVRDLIIKLEHNRIQDAEKILKRAEEAGIWILKNLDDTGGLLPETLQNAAQLAYAGRLFLPEKNINDPVMINGQPKGEVMEKVPQYALEMLSTYRYLKEAANILYHIYENFDGSGIPKKIKSWQIPLGSRILRAVLDYEEIQIKQKLTPGKAMEALEHESKRIYDYRIVAMLDQYNAVHSVGGIGREKKIEKKELEPRMIISRSIITEAGMKVVAAGTQLTEEKINTLRKMTKSDPIIGNIYIRD